MARLFRRVFNLIVAPKSAGAGTALSAIESAQAFQCNNLDCSFKIKKSLKAEPNTCEVKILNLAETTRRVLETPKALIVKLEAGYEGALAQLYLGEVRTAYTTVANTDYVTTLESGDSAKEIATSRINVSMGPKVPADVALASIAKALGVGGNVAKATAALRAKGVTPFGPGTLLYGKAATILQDFCRSADLEWSIQDGVLQILDRGKALEDKAVLLSPSTGLIESPSINFTDKQLLVKAKALIQPDLRPGRKVVFDSLSFKSNKGYVIQSCEYSGDTAGGDWTVSLECKAY